MITDKEIENFVKPFYKNKDTMHNLDHIKRVKKKLIELASKYGLNSEFLEIATYFHGIWKDNLDEINNFLSKNGFTNDQINHVISLTKNSDKDESPKDLEGKLIHDAHLLEGGKYFYLLKSLIAAGSNGVSLKDSIKYFEKNLLKYKCEIHELQIEFEEYIELSTNIIKDLKSQI